MLFIRILSCVAIIEVAASLHAATPQQAANPSTPGVQYRTILDRYCIACHNQKLKTADLTLDQVDVENPPSGAEVWEKVIRKLRTNAMPPAGMPRPDKATNDSFANYLENSIDKAARAKVNPGTPTIHRLNRAEYANTIHDLLAVDIDAESLLPVDDAGYGFDNNGDVLSVSPLLLERYLMAARKIARLAIGDPAMRPTVETYEVADEVVQADRMGEDLPLGSRGGLSIHHNFPADGEYVIKVRLKRDGTGENAIRGVGLKRQLGILLDRQELKLFTVGGEHYGRSAGDDGLSCVTGALVSCRGDSAQEEYERHGADAGLELRVPITAGPHVLKAAFLVEDISEPEGPFRKGGVNTRRGGRRAEPSVDTVAISGPYDATSLGETPSRKKIFMCHPSGNGITSVPGDEACARTILSTVARRAYRRTVTDDDIEPLMKFYRAGIGEGGFEAGIRKALERILVGLQFLFRIEWSPTGATPGTTYRISDIDLASRLSYFLWSSMPDDELLGLAERGKLKDPELLNVQVQRMLADPRSKALVKNFTGQWLQLRRLDRLSPDIQEFPDFDENLRQAFMQETELFLESMVREDQPLMDLLKANYTFLNERLARHYGVPNVYGSTFRRVGLADENRRGLLGQGSILSLTSYPTRTSVVLRGVWLLTNLMGTPPPPPPPNVPSLKDRTEDGKIKSVRQSMEEHRASPVCASCHARMDPLGFALENFNAIGQWRTTEGAANTPIDTSGALPDGTKFQGPAELSKLLLNQPSQFATTVTEKLLTYALGRGAEYYDQPTVRKVMKEAAPDYRWSSLILGVVQSEPFQMRRTREP